VEACRRIATADSASADGSEPASDQDAGDSQVPAPGAPPTRVPRARRAIGFLIAAGIGALAALGTERLLDDSTPPPAPSTKSVTGLRMLAVGSWARIHPARTPKSCLTEGVDRTGRYETAVAAQRPCAEAALPRVFLEPLSTDIVQIQWHHPEHGIGCLTVLLDGPGRGLLEPRDDCADDNPAQQFRVEPVDLSATAHFRIRPVVTDQCLSLRDQSNEDGTEIVQGRCSGAGDQDFLIELIAPA
jgi:hypothetical protein